MKTFVLKIRLKQPYNRSCTAHAPRPCSRCVPDGTQRQSAGRTAPCFLSCAQQARLKGTRQTARLNRHAARQHYKVTADRPLLYQPHTCRPNARQLCRPPLCNPHCPDGQPCRSCPNVPARKTGLTGQGNSMQGKGADWQPMQAMLLCMLPCSDGSRRSDWSSRYDGPPLRWPASRAAAPAVQADAHADAQADELQACPHSWTVLAP